jgi:hypothetical protein
MPEQKQEIVRSTDFHDVYANSARITVTFWDFRFLFGEVEELTPEVLKLSETVKVTMSPQHTKVFLRILDENVRKYEEKFGEIKIPTGAVADIPETKVT